MVLSGDFLLHSFPACMRQSLIGKHSRHICCRLFVDGYVTMPLQVAKRYEALGWQVLCVDDANHDLDAISSTIKRAKGETSKPTLIIVSQNWTLLVDEPHPVHFVWTRCTLR